VIRPGASARTRQNDEQTRVFATVDQGDARWMRLRLKNALRRFRFKKASIALNGVSLPLNALSAQSVEGQFAVDIVLPLHTLSRNNLRHFPPSSHLTIEANGPAKT
jgi:riboflavin synthase alpha subunit